LTEDSRIITSKRDLNKNTFMKTSFGFGGRSNITIFEVL